MEGPCQSELRRLNRSASIEAVCLPVPPGVPGLERDDVFRNENALRKEDVSDDVGAPFCLGVEAIEEEGEVVKMVGVDAAWDMINIHMSSCKQASEGLTSERQSTVEKPGTAIAK